MKILMPAAAVSPYSGSEPYVGWLWAKAAAQEHEVWLVVADWCMGPLERAEREGLIPPNLHVVRAGRTRFRPPKNPFWARVFTWVEYREFLHDLQATSARLAREIPFDLVHQTTLATWRMGMPMAGGSLLSVWGPLGGGEEFPFQFLPLLSRSAKFYEISRALLSWLAAHNPAIRRAARRADVVISTNADTDRALRRLDRTGPILRCPMLLQQSRFDQIVSLPRKPNASGALRIFAGGGLDGRKGVGVSLEVLAELKKRGVAFRFTVGGHGSELPHLRAKAAQLGLDVDFRPDLSGEDYLRQLAATDVILFPSLRDNTALTLVEAVAAGAIPVVIDHGGPGELVREEFGFKVAVGPVRETIRCLADAVVEASKGQIESAAGRERVKNCYLEDQAGRTISEAYALVMRKRAGHSPAQHASPPDCG